MTTEELLKRALAFCLAVGLFVLTYVIAFFAWTLVLGATGDDFDFWSTHREDPIWFVLIAALLWAAVGAIVARWWVLAVPLAPYLWERGREVVEYGDIDIGPAAWSLEVWLVVAVCALGIGTGLRIWASQRGV